MNLAARLLALAHAPPPTPPPSTAPPTPSAWPWPVEPADAESAAELVDLAHAVAERAAIMHLDGGLPRPEADRLALADVAAAEGIHVDALGWLLTVAPGEP